ncbi:MAG: Fic family protein [Bacteroidales bacterium]
MNRGLSFQLQFIKLDYKHNLERTKQLQQELQQELRQELHKQSMYSDILFSLETNAQSRQDISTGLGQKKVSGQLNKVIQRLIEQNLIARTIPEKPNHPAQKFVLTDRGFAFLKLLKERQNRDKLWQKYSESTLLMKH